jgi:hypothetical protein
VIKPGGTPRMQYSQHEDAALLEAPGMRVCTDYKTPMTHTTTLSVTYCVEHALCPDTAICLPNNALLWLFVCTTINHPSTSARQPLGSAILPSLLTE